MSGNILRVHDHRHEDKKYGYKYSFHAISRLHYSTNIREIMKLIYKFTVNQLPPGFAVGTVQNVIFKQLPPPTPPYTGGELITKQFLPPCKGKS